MFWKISFHPSHVHSFTEFLFEICWPKSSKYNFRVFWVKLAFHFILHCCREGRGEVKTKGRGLLQSWVWRSLRTFLYKYQISWPRLRVHFFCKVQPRLFFKLFLFLQIPKLLNFEKYKKYPQNAAKWSSSHHTMMWNWIEVTCLTFFNPGQRSKSLHVKLRQFYFATTLHGLALTCMDVR